MMPKKKRHVSGSIAECLERLAILQRRCEVQHLTVPHLFKYHLHFKKKKQHIDYKDSLEPLSPAVENSGIQKEEAHAYSRQSGCYRKQAVPLSRCTWMVLRTVKLQVYYVYPKIM